MYNQFKITAKQVCGIDGSRRRMWAYCSGSRIPSQQMIYSPPPTRTPVSETRFPPIRRRETGQIWPMGAKGDKVTVGECGGVSRACVPHMSAAFPPPTPPLPNAKHTTIILLILKVLHCYLQHMWEISIFKQLNNLFIIYSRQAKIIACSRFSR